MAGEIFISYRRSDLAQAKRLHDLLKAEGIEAWYDAQVGAGQDWRAVTAAALSKSRIFVLLFSKPASESDDIAKELAAATFSKKLVIPVRLEDIQPEGPFLYELASRNWVNAFEDTDARLAELARSLATLVKSGGTDDSGLPFDRDSVSLPRRREPRWRRLALMGLGVVAAAIVLGAGIAILGANGPKAVPGRIAFFGVDAPADDKGAASAASATTSTILNTFVTLQRDVAASADTEGVAPKDRLDRAAKLRAVYAIGGTVTRLGDTLSVSIRIEDTPSRTALWSDALTGPAFSPTSLANRVAALLNDRMNCIISARKSVATEDMRVIARLPRACESVRFTRPDNADRWQELADLAPNSAWVLAGEAEALFIAIPNATPGAADKLRQKATDALKRAMQIDPNAVQVTSARIAEAQTRAASAKEIEEIFLDGLKRSPDEADMNGTYAQFLSLAGRLKDSMPYGKKCLALDPLSMNKMIGVALATMRSGAPAEQVEPLFAQRHVLFPDVFEWSLHLMAALFSGVGDVDAILADPPPDAPTKLKACFADLARAARKRTPAAYKEAARHVAECEASGAMYSIGADMFRAYLGDYEPIFAPNADVEVNRLLYFDPAVPGLRADPRFLPMMEKMGLLAYWRDSGHPPDFCATEKAPVCAAIAAK